METKKLPTQTHIQQPKTRTQHFPIKIRLVNQRQKQQRATQDIMVNPEARPSIQQHNKEMHALLTGKISHHHISRTAQAPEQKIRTHFKMLPRK